MYANTKDELGDRIKVECAECCAAYRLRPEMAGKRVRCRTAGCEEIIHVPADGPGDRGYPGFEVVDTPLPTGQLTPANPDALAVLRGMAATLSRIEARLAVWLLLAAALRGFDGTARAQDAAKGGWQEQMAEAIKQIAPAQPAQQQQQPQAAPKAATPVVPKPADPLKQPVHRHPTGREAEWKNLAASLLFLFSGVTVIAVLVAMAWWKLR